MLFPWRDFWPFLTSSWHSKYLILSAVPSASCHCSHPLCLPLCLQSPGRWCWVFHVSRWHRAQTQCIEIHEFYEADGYEGPHFHNCSRCRHPQTCRLDLRNQSSGKLRMLFEGSCAQITFHAYLQGLCFLHKIPPTTCSEWVPGLCHEKLVGRPHMAFYCFLLNNLRGILIPVMAPVCSSPLVKFQIT